MIVAVDGPSGSGKSSVCRAVAQRIGFILVDTGALYRAVALMADRRGMDYRDEHRMSRLARSLELTFIREGEGEQKLICNGRDITKKIRTPKISDRASVISQYRPVREALLEIQRQMGRAQDSIVEGRDIGTVVFPDADLKIFYTASLEIRAYRRWKELRERGNLAIGREMVLKEIKARDRRDRERVIAPLRRAADAILMDTTDLSFEQACDRLEALILEKRRAL